jgi:hypothetical protein
MSGESKEVERAAAVSVEKPAKPLHELVQALHGELKKLAVPSSSSSPKSIADFAAEALLAAAVSYRESMAGDDASKAAAVEQAKLAAAEKLKGLREGDDKQNITLAVGLLVDLPAAAAAADAAARAAAARAADGFAALLSAAQLLANRTPLSTVLDIALVSRNPSSPSQPLDDDAKKAEKACSVAVANHLISENFQADGSLKSGKKLGEVLAQINAEFPAASAEPRAAGPFVGGAGAGAAADAGAGTGAAATAAPHPNAAIHQTIIEIQQLASPPDGTEEDPKKEKLFELIRQIELVRNSLIDAGVIELTDSHVTTASDAGSAAASRIDADTDFQLASGKTLSDLFLELEKSRVGIQRDADSSSAAGAGASEAKVSEPPADAASSAVSNPAKELLKLMDENQEKLNKLYQDSLAAKAVFEIQQKTRAEIWAAISALKDLPADWTSGNDGKNIVTLNKKDSPSINIHLSDDGKLSFTATEAPDVINAQGKKETKEIKSEFFKDYFSVMFKALKEAGGTQELQGGVDQLIKGLARQYGCTESEIKKGLQDANKASPDCFDCLTAKTRKEFETAATPQSPPAAGGQPMMTQEALARARAAAAPTPPDSAPTR